MMLASFYIIIGFVALAWAADRLVFGAAVVARHFGLSPLLIGVTIVALGTSAPEIFVSINAAYNGNVGLSVGNAIGSNIANICLVVGVTALISPLTVNSKILRREYFVLALVMMFTWALILDGHLGQIDGVLLLLALLAILAWLTILAKRSRRDSLSAEFKEELPKDVNLKRAWFWMLLGLLLLPMSADMIVTGSVRVAEYFGVSDLIIGLTIIALGTSLPEVATSIIASVKQEDEIAIGNVIGSNIFNLVAVLPFPGLLAPGTLSRDVLTRDMPMMLIATTLLLIFAYGWRKREGRVTRLEGGLLLLTYFGYLGFLLLA